ncbi:MAG: YceI family protein [Candidatus Kapabacteria bacterium]|nr:YceI family protein [Candidatus Kapabacteria bacterium]
MKVPSLASLVLAGLTSASIAFAGTGFSGAQGGSKSYKLNNSVGKNAITFLSKAPAEDINGTADGVSGTFALDAANLEATKGKIEVAVKTMKTANSKRDEHMYSEVWLDEANHPKITFDIQSLKDVKVTNDGGRNVATATAVGTFSLHGVTKQITAPVMITFIPESAETKKRASGNLVQVKTNFTVPLKDYNVKGKEGVVGKSVGETISVQAELFANS